MKTVVLKPTLGNMTSAVIAALDEIRDGGSLIFENGEYHFYTDGARERFFAPSNNANGIKKTVFPMFDMQNITVDGSGSTFVFHGETFPFIVHNSKNTVIKNLVLTMSGMPYLTMKMGKKSEEGFELVMKSGTRCEVDSEGHLFFLDEEGSVIVDSSSRIMALHSLDRICIQYLIAGSTTADKSVLATTYYDTVAEKTENGVFLKYVPTEKGVRCIHNEGENIGVIIWSRKRDVFFLEDSENTVIENVTVRRGSGMGIIAQCCENIRVKGFCALPYDGEPSPLTADALHFVNCTGIIDVLECEIKKSMDDFLNVHGNYAYVSSVSEGELGVKIGHHEQSLFLPYKKGDSINVIDRATLEIKGSVVFNECRFTDEKGMNALVGVSGGTSFIKSGDLLENAKRMPTEVNFVGNKGTDIPRVLLAGGKRYRYANNEIRGFTCAMKIEDVPGYWCESGRCGEVIMENNILDGKGKFGGAPIIRVCVSGYERGGAPKVHEKVVIRNNVFENIGDKIVFADGVKALVLENNIIR